MLFLFLFVCLFVCLSVFLFLDICFPNKYLFWNMKDYRPKHSSLLYNSPLTFLELKWFWLIPNWLLFKTAGYGMLNYFKFTSVDAVIPVITKLPIFYCVWFCLLICMFIFGFTSYSIQRIDWGLQKTYIVVALHFIHTFYFWLFPSVWDCPLRTM